MMITMVLEEKYKEFIVSYELFRFFQRKNFPDIEMSNENCDEIGLEFAKYLYDLDLNELQKENILPISEFDVILNANAPFRMFGFHAAYLLHFTEFIKESIKDYKEEENG